MVLCNHINRTEILNQVNEPIGEICNQCNAKLPIRKYPIWANVCEWCGYEYVLPVKKYRSWRRWLSSRFCSCECYREDLADRKDNNKPLLKPGQLAPTTTVVTTHK